jgi:hypothetical protein
LSSKITLGEGMTSTGDIARAASMTDQNPGSGRAKAVWQVLVPGIHREW